MKKYKVIIIDDAKEDIIQIIYYIKYKLKEPNLAEKYKNNIKTEIIKLEDNAGIYRTIDEEIIGVKSIKKINVKNFIIFYKIYEKENIAKVLAVFYSKSNWQEKIKNRK